RGILEVFKEAASFSAASAAAFALLVGASESRSVPMFIEVGPGNQD
ncbi:hypothetical protein THAOC_04716, partial [Thalassiosira oceanica]